MNYTVGENRETMNAKKVTLKSLEEVPEESGVILDEAACGCTAREYADDTVVICFCPLHEAAGELLAALKFIASDIEESVNDKAAWLRKARAAIAKAERKED